MLATETRLAPLVKRIGEARLFSDELFGIIRPGALYQRPIPERHRIIFYVGHLEAFDWNLLHEILGLKSFNPEFDRLFAFGIDPVGSGLPSDQPADWPSLPIVRHYVTQVRTKLDEKLSSETTEADPSSRDGFPLTVLLNVAIEHRLMHLETLAYMLHQLPIDCKIPQTDPPEAATPSVDSQMVPISEGDVILGLPRQSEDFGWDNEFESHSVHVPAFQIDQYQVTNQHYLEFMKAGGYEARELWTDEAWNWKNSQGISHPVFWKKSGDSWLYRAMFEEVPLPLNWPVYVSHAEASAFAQWAGKSLPSEAEWQRAAYGTRGGEQRYYPWGTKDPDSTLGNFDFHRWNPASVNAFPQSKSAFGVEGMLGNGWEWTSTVWAPFPGFQPFPFYRGYSADFFDGKHFVIKGGSSRTAACMLRPTFRNWFQGQYQYVYAGFRCVSR